MYQHHDNISTYDKAFNLYLRRGIPPVLLKQSSNPKPIWAVDLEKEKQLSRAPLIPITADEAASALGEAILGAESLMDQAAAEHLKAFTAQMREKLGVGNIELHEPYLPYLKARTALELLKTLGRLEENLLPPGGGTAEQRSVATAAMYGGCAPLSSSPHRSPSACALPLQWGAREVDKPEQKGPNRPHQRNFSAK